jgi:hypothetical protein
MVILALADGLRVIEIPVNYRGRVGQSKITGSRIRALSVGLRMLGLIAAYRVRLWVTPGRVRRRIPVSPEAWRAHRI